VNGSNVTFYDFGPGSDTLYPTRQQSGFQYPYTFTSVPEYILVKVQDLQLQLPGLPYGIVPLQPVTFTWSAGRHRSVKMQQFPVTLAYAMTDYKCQGQTFDRVLLDLQKPQTGPSSPASLYVQLSRARSLDSISIMRPFDVSELSIPLDSELVEELQWQQEKGQVTINTYRQHYLVYKDTSSFPQGTNIMRRIRAALLSLVLPVPLTTCPTLNPLN
jgi:hypothetical protein